MLRVTTVFSGPPGAPYYSTFYFGGTTAGEADVAHASTETFWDGLQAGLRTDMTSVQEADVPQIDPATGNIVQIYSETLRNQDYAAAGDPLPMATQLLIRWRTGVYVNGREIRGRTFIPGYTETSSTNGMPATTTVTGVQTLAEDLLTNAAGAGGLVVYSPTNGQAAAVATTSVWTQWAVMRSRRD